MKKALITGVTGQDGSYLSEMLLGKGYEVYGLNRRKAIAGLSNLGTVADHGSFQIVEGDLLEESRLNSVVRDIAPDEVYNLASQSFVPYSWDNPVYTTDVNALGVVRILEAIRTYAPGARFYQASSSEMYGNVQEMPQTEMTYQYPRSPYGCTKSFGFNVTRNYRESYGMFACNGILFNHESERRGHEFVTRKITHTVASIATGTADKLTLGNLNAKRDWGYAPDYVRAMWLMLQHDQADDYVIATGRAHTIREFTELAFRAVDMEVSWEGEGMQERGLVDGKVAVEVSEEFYRPAEVDVLEGDPSKAKSALGWEPEVSFKEMVKRMVDHDLALANSGG